MRTCKAWKFNNCRISRNQAVPVGTTIRQGIMWLVSLLLIAVGHCAHAQPIRQCTGVRVGEVTPTTANVWTRLTAASTRKDDGSCSGARGTIVLRYSKSSTLAGAITSATATVSAATDFTKKFNLKGLSPGTTYYYQVSTKGRTGLQHAPLSGKFQTAPSPTIANSIVFTVMTCQGNQFLDNTTAGFNIYPQMAKLNPKFSVSVGDLVYYDNESPLVRNKSIARFHWARMYSLPNIVNFHRQFSGYFARDDHDTLSNDCHPGAQPLGNLTFNDGKAIFREQMPIGAATYRTFRWGTELQIWILDSRDYRSNNDVPDGPRKTLLGAAQKAWLKRTVTESTATWKIIVTPTPLVGPDRASHTDNLANPGFMTEGDEIRRFLSQGTREKSLFIITGDRHWAYHSVHPATGLHEFSGGPASDSRAKVEGAAQYNAAIHRYWRVKGGFVSVQVLKTGSIKFTLHNVQGTAVHSYTATKA